MLEVGRGGQYKKPPIYTYNNRVLITADVVSNIDIDSTKAQGVCFASAIGSTRSVLFSSFGQFYKSNIETLNFQIFKYSIYM